MTSGARVDEWTGRGVSVAAIERELTRLRNASAGKTAGSDLRTSVMTHMAWVPEEWLGAAAEVLAGLAERHPSRTLMLVPDPAGDDRLDADVSLQCVPLQAHGRHVCSELVKLRLCGRFARAPASIVQPLLISDLPVFLRWRGEPPFAASEFEQLVAVTDRLVIDSREWEDVVGCYRRLCDTFDHAAVSDIAWSLTLGWRMAIASLWPDVADIERVAVRGPSACALLLAGWLRSRLRRRVDLDHEEADDVDAVAVDGHEVEAPPDDPRTPADLLSDELDVFGRDPIYEEAVRATA